jgi:hypothetical protein
MQDFRVFPLRLLPFFLLQVSGFDVTVISSMEPQSKRMFAVKGCLQVYRCFFKSNELLEEIFCFRTIKRFRFRTVKRSFPAFVSETSRDLSQLVFQNHQEDLSPGRQQVEALHKIFVYLECKSVL